jgi:predicted N-acetyltransferase YhbS
MPPELAALHAAVAEDFTSRFGAGFWSSSPSERGIVANMRKPRFSRTLIARSRGHIAGALRLHTKKPWAIDTAYFTAAKQPLYLTGMAVHPKLQRKGVGRLLVERSGGPSRARGRPTPFVSMPSTLLWEPEPSMRRCGFREVARVTYKKGSAVVF